ncbi:hypothetical protein MYCTH_2141608 [Thermothelomyces thermophilus ATCC 42464]|uniref:Threonine/serine exporter-like N-terminal domain-containing protein n=1 Tax=Thermothelomyces thermophilus (strain ATCC 42464 / BCRC 31852 / DSM 1799) TaxID=573729 RepID=G2Q4Y0_THET4|nr:uncharacterized protein MYCTH_2141608 [Thermothelomyces thermophilus ATCC 42464]AEO53717.1 hypothetical protein MYCTH_2141608 [Thermothelomyces thermophilus ATCC 42464]
MASPPAPGLQTTPGDDGREQRRDLSPAPLPPKGKEKKRVGFASDRQPPANSPGSPFHTAQGEPENDAQDYFSFTPSPNSNGSTPLHPEGLTRRPSVDEAELAAAVARYFEGEQTSGRAESHAGPSRPRPVLRKSSAITTPDEMPTAPHRSEVEAKNRADRLAYDVGTSSVPVSGRSSVDSGRETVDHDDQLLDQAAAAAQDLGPEGDSEMLRRRRNAHLEADQLVKAHRRRKSPLINSFFPPRSGTATPVEHDVEYVPPPPTYKGGILGTLLKLYNAEDKYGSAYTDSSAASTPVSSPPTSRSSTPKPDSRRSRPRAAQSSSTLTGLMESSFVFAAPGSSKDISEAVSEKVKQEASKSRKTAKSKKKAEEYRIKIHIAEIINRHTYLLKLCRALMTYGAPTHRLEAYMRMSARVLGIEGQFLYLPDTMIISFDDSNTHTTEVKIVRAGQGLDFGRLRDVHEIYKEVVHDRIGVDEATARLDEITARKPKFPVWLRIILYGIASAMVAPFGFEGRYIDMPICFILGCLVGFLQLYLSPSNELYANVFEITAAVATSFLARVFGSIRGGTLFCFSSLAQASIALILPGYMVLCASLELQSHQMVSGSVRMVYALIYTLFLGYGFTIGLVIYGYMDSNAVSDVHCSVGDSWYTKRPPENYYLLFVFPFTLCLCFINQAKWKQTPVQVFISLAGFCVNNFSSRFFKGNGIVPSSLGAFTIGVLANLYSRLGRYTQNWLLDMWEHHVEPRLYRLAGKFRPRHSPYYNCPPAVDSDETISNQKTHAAGDLEMGGGAMKPQAAAARGGPAPRARHIGYGLAAAAMLPAIFVQVPSGLAASGSLLSGVTSADQIVRNETLLANGTVVNGNTSVAATSQSGSGGDLTNSAFSVLFSVIQVAINISVGLSLSALLVYPFGKRRSGLFSF